MATKPKAKERGGKSQVQAAKGRDGKVAAKGRDGKAAKGREG